MSLLKRKSKKATATVPLFARLSLFFFSRPKISLVIWLGVLLVGVASYTTLLKREGFPTITVPYSMVNGTYLVNDAVKVDADVGKPLSKIISSSPNVKFSDVTSSANYRFVFVPEYLPDS